MKLTDHYEQVITDVKGLLAHNNPGRLPADKLSEHSRRIEGDLLDVLGFLQMRQMVLPPDAKPGQTPG